MENTVNNIKQQPVLKPYKPIKLTAFGKMVKLTMGGSASKVEGGGNAQNGRF